MVKRQLKSIDLFAGMGGNSEGARLAGVDVVAAANHWELAVKYHKINHPRALHICQDLHQADWSRFPFFDILMASPCCQGFSNARGTDKPHHDTARSTAWAVVSCAEYHRPEWVIVENVPEFQQWILFPSWRDAMQRLGYDMKSFVRDAADHGVPQHRKRVFLVGKRNEMTPDLWLPNFDHKPASSIIDWNDNRWQPVHKLGRSEKRLEQWEKGRSEFGERFLMPYYGRGSGLTGRSLDRPIGTITTRDRWAVVDGQRMRMLSAKECLRAQGFPENYVRPAQHKQAVHMIGNAVPPPMMRDILLSIKENM